MATEQNNIQVNTFTGGMNSDTSLDMVKAEQYVFGQNIRITKNALLNACVDANNTEGIVTPIPEGKLITSSVLDQNISTESVKNLTVPKGTILATASLNNIGAIVMAYEDKWSVYKITIDEDEVVFNRVVTFDDKPVCQKFSVVINKEREGTTKLYIADTVHPIIEVNLDDPDYYNNLVSDTYSMADMCSSNRMYPSSQVKITNKIGGSLKTSQVQYTYRFYNKHGICSRLAPLTSKIQIIDTNRNKETGNAEDTQTSIGLALRVSIPSPFDKVFDHIQLYRLSYIKPGQNADVELIYDASIKEAGDSIDINDTGFESLQDLSIDEFSSLSGQTLIPKVIEQNQGYMFGANIKDESVIRISSTDFDAKTFQFNRFNKIVLYSSTDYSESSKLEYTSINDIPDDISLYNKYVDINETPDTQSCMFNDKRGFGGVGKNINWQFVFAKVPIHEDYLNTETPTILKGAKDNHLYRLQLQQDTQYPDGHGAYVQLEDTVQSYLNSQNIFVESTISYDEIIGSSKLRSLRRNEVYRYGIVFYDKYGTRSDVLWIADIRTPTAEDAPITKEDYGDSIINAMAMGIQFDVTVPNQFKDKYNIVSYEIVRCELSDKYQRNIYQCVVSRPVRQAYSVPGNSGDAVTYSPYYPTCFLTSKWQQITPGYGKEYVHEDAQTDVNGPLMIFNPEIQISRDDSLSKLSTVNLKIRAIQYIYGITIDQYNKDLIDPVKSEDVITLSSEGNLSGVGSKYLAYDNIQPLQFTDENVLLSRRFRYRFSKSDKSSDNHVYKYYNKINKPEDNVEFDILTCSDVKSPTWEQGFSDVQLNGSSVQTAIKQYKAYLNGMGTIMFNNWVSNAMYDLRVSSEESQNGLTVDYDLFAIKTDTYKIKQSQHESRIRVFTSGTDVNSEERANDMNYCLSRRGWIGPGPQCLLIQTDTITSDMLLDRNSTDGKQLTTIGTVLCNITHTAIQYAGLLDTQKQYDVYYGFGDYVNLTGNSGTSKVFDGNIYITPCEIVTLFKAYDFNSVLDSLMSSQVLYYVPMESIINTFFDYGMNYRNTQNTNLQLEPGDIEGIASQNRPLHQYNSIYSDNSISNNVFNAQAIEEADVVYPQRIIYSEHKTNGEEIDSWHVFKAADFIDADSRYGEVTNLLTSHDILYYWQNTAFGKLSVNERSLVKDENSNTIQLGQGGVLQRVDYLDVRHGMRPQDFSAISVETSVFWIDIMNKAVMAYAQGIIDYGERVNVQNIINHRISEEIPTIHYDVQNQELLCKMFGHDQIVFNLKLGVATSLYTREYNEIISLDNTLYGISDNVLKYNNLYDSDGIEAMKETELQFVVNQVPSTTKVFDNQKIVRVQPPVGTGYDEFDSSNIDFEFMTDMYSTTNNIEGTTDRENNILYAIPRFGAENYGNRMRGKWMKVSIKNNKSSEFFAISHIITKFRQSFS